MVRSRSVLTLGILLVGVVLFVGSSSLLSGVVPSFAAQDPRVSFDILPEGNTYTDSARQPERLGPSNNPWIVEPGNQCGLVATNGPANSADEDSDGVINDGCPAVGLLHRPETGVQCLNAVDDDFPDDAADLDPNNPHTVGLVNDGCPSVGIIGNTMGLGTIDDCSSTSAPGNNNAHLHAAQLVVENVENLIGWQARLNYDGGKMRPFLVNFTPFSDNGLGQNISFVNLPIDAATQVHREVFGATNIPAQAAGPQSALIGSTYAAAQNAPISPDTPYINDEPAKTYDAPDGGVLATVTLQVLAGNSGQLMSMDVDDDDPTAPGSKVVVFTMGGTLDIPLGESALGDGAHGEGVPCPGPTPTETSSPTASPTATASPSTTPSLTASPTPTPSPSPVALEGKVTGGGQVLGDPIFSPEGELLSPPAIIASILSGGQANFGFAVHAGNPATGNLSYDDPGGSTAIKASSFDALSFSDGRCGPGTHASFDGIATVNGEAGKAFRVDAEDCGQPGVGTDSFSIQVLEPDGYSNSGVLSGGNIQIHR